MSDTRAKLEELFRRLTTAPTDIEAMEACIWFRKLMLNATDVVKALGPGASEGKEEASAPVAAGPTMPFGKWKGVELSKLAKDAPDYLRWLLGPDMKKPLADPLRSQVRAALGMPIAEPAKPVSQDFENP